MKYNRFMGEYDDNTIYQAGDVVNFDGASYYRKVPGKGISPIARKKPYTVWSRLNEDLSTIFPLGGGGGITAPVSDNLLTGYQEGYRISASSGSVSENAATDLSDFIPCAIGDMFELKSMQMPMRTANVGVHFYASDKATKLLSVVGWDGESGFPGNNWAYTAVGENVTGFTVPNWTELANVAYMRIVASEINASSAIVKKMPNQYLVTDSNGNTGWAERLAWDDSTIIEWNGDTSVAAEGYNLYKMSDVTPAVDDLLGCFLETIYNGIEQSAALTEQHIDATDDDVCIGAGGMFAVAYKDSAMFTMPNGSTVVFPSKGTYFYYGDENRYTKRMVIERLHPIDPKYMPSPVVLFHNNNDENLYWSAEGVAAQDENDKVTAAELDELWNSGVRISIRRYNGSVLHGQHVAISYYPAQYEEDAASVCFYSGGEVYSYTKEHSGTPV